MEEVKKAETKKTNTENTKAPEENSLPTESQAEKPAADKESTTKIESEDDRELMPVAEPKESVEITSEQDEDDGYVHGLIYEYDMEYTKEHMKLYMRTGEKGILTKPSLIFAGVVLLLGLIFMISRGSFGVLIAGLVVAATVTVFPFLTRLVGEWNYFRENRTAWTCWKHISMYDDKVVIETPNATFQYQYDDFYKCKENDAFFYMIAGSHGIVILDKTKTPRNVIEAVRELFGQPEEEF